MASLDKHDKKPEHETSSTKDNKKTNIDSDEFDNSSFTIAEFIRIREKNKKLRKRYYIMLRDFIVIENKPAITIYKAAAAMVTGMAVQITDTAWHKLRRKTGKVCRCRNCG